MNSHTLQPRVYLQAINTAYLDPKAIQKAIADGLQFCRGAQTKPKAPPSRQSLWCEVALASSLKHKFRNKENSAHSTVSQHQFVHPAFTEAYLDLVSMDGQSETPPKDRYNKIYIAHSPLEGLKSKSILRHATGGQTRFIGQGYLAFSESVEFYAPDDYQSRDRGMKGKLVTHIPKKYPDGANGRPQQNWAPDALLQASEVVFLNKLTLPFDDDFARAQTFVNHTLRLQARNPDFIITDGLLIAKTGKYFSFKTEEFGLIVIANSAQAHDAVLEQIFSYQPTIELEQLARSIRMSQSATPKDIDPDGITTLDTLELIQAFRKKAQAFIPAQTTPAAYPIVELNKNLLGRNKPLLHFCNSFYPELQSSPWHRETLLQLTEILSLNKKPIKKPMPKAVHNGPPPEITHTSTSTPFRGISIALNTFDSFPTHSPLFYLYDDSVKPGVRFELPRPLEDIISAIHWQLRCSKRTTLLRTTLKNGDPYWVVARRHTPANAKPSPVVRWSGYFFDLYRWIYVLSLGRIKGPWTLTWPLTWRF